MLSNWTTHTVRVNGVRLCYYRTGKKGNPSLVLAHGITDNALCWTRVALALESDYDIVMYDARGHGLSDKPPQGYAPETLAQDLISLVHALRLQRPFLLGHSLGAETVAIAAALEPELATCIILEDPPWRDLDQQTTIQERTEHYRQSILRYKTKTLHELITTCRERHPSWDETEITPWAIAKLQVSPYVVQTIAVPWPSWRELLKQIRCPILLITADPDRGGIVTPSVVQEAQSLRRKGQVVHIAGAGHSIHRDNFAKYIRAVKSFLKHCKGAT